MKCIKKYYTALLSVRDTFENHRQKQTEINGWPKLHHSKSNQERAEVSLLILDKIDFETRIATGDKGILP